MTNKVEHRQKLFPTKMYSACCIMMHPKKNNNKTML